MNSVVRRLAQRRSRVLPVVALAPAASLILAGCSAGSSGSTATGTPATEADAPILATLDGSEKERVAQLIGQAREEGGLNWMDSVVAETSEAALVDAFKKQYGLPDLTVKFDRVKTGDIAAQIPQQVTARKITTDVVGTAAPDLFASLKEAGSLLEYRSPEAAAYDAAAKYVDEEKGYWVSPYAYAFEPIASPEHFTGDLTSWEGLLDPALKGHLSIGDARNSQAILYNYIAMKKVLPDSFFTQLAAQDPIFSSGGSIQDTQAVSTGEVLASLTSGFRALQTVKQTGIPITVSYPKEGVIMIGQSYGILQGSPHPATAKLFEDFLLSKEGLQQIVDLEGVTPTRTGITVSDEVKKYAPASLDDVKVIPMDYSKLDSDALKAALADWEKVFVK